MVRQFFCLVLSLNAGIGTGFAQQSTPDIFLEVQIEPQTPYVQAQVLYSERLYYSVAAIHMRQGAFSHMQPPDDVIMQRFGEEIAYITNRGGRSYGVLQRNYLIFPQRSGDITLPALKFRGRTAEQSQTKDPQDRFITTGELLQLENPALVMSVKPQPGHYTGKHWLPSPNLTLTESWSAEPQQLQIGQPVTRTVIVEAQGLQAEQLPQLPEPEISNATVYRDPVINNTYQDERWVYARQEQRLAIVPSAAGELHLPAIELIWWNTRTGQQQTARLAQRIITILPVPATELAPATPLQTSNSAGFWPWLSAGLLILWLFTLLAWWQQNKRNRTKIADKQQLLSTEQAFAALKKACQNNNPQAAAKALLAWSNSLSPRAGIHNLALLAEQLDNAREPVLALEQILYAKQQNPWDSTSLWQATRNGLGLKFAANSKTNHNELVSLYPISSPVTEGD